MSVLDEALEFLGLSARSNTHDPYELAMPGTRTEQRELAEAMRRLPGRFAGRVSAQVREQVNAAAAAGRWEQAVDRLVTALRASGEVLSDQEHELLGAVLQALNMSGERLDALTRRQNALAQPVRDAHGSMSTSPGSYGPES
ncbi:hypothetical protein GCM10027176_10560 [Actinoallomurus bryophytorum]|uniref:Uncharacterized protein n=1 Tax=Actinoallomurus bryophytorum TaxID=1490222 RepID=A0A543BZC6_9ACTN|nr:hypothetical protein [Actinoallomurus bryophytorum]TQL90181.1 hypothetical protein FB559_7474 [Actinoallomurus bryophytorum]